MKLVFTWLLAVSLVVGVLGCETTKGDDEDDPQPGPGVTKTELLAGTSTKSWRVEVAKVNGLNVLPYTLACAKDDNWVFNTNKTYERNEGATKCKPTDEQVYEKGSWEFNTAETELILNKTTKYTISNFTRNTLEISTKNVSGETEELTLKAN
ncbi:MAG: hypothetical protein ACK41O_10420 [Runella zeae]